MDGRWVMYYFDNAATSYPKPEPVYQACDSYLRQAANPGRGVYALSLECARAVHAARLSIAEFLGIAKPERLIFTPGCTYSLNIALKAVGLREGDVVLASSVEHNAVARTLEWLKGNTGIIVHRLPYRSPGIIHPGDIEAAALLAPKLLCLCEASNVTGDLAEITQIAAACREHDILLLVDAAQSAGVLRHNLTQAGVDLFCASGHKGLLGPPGVGLLYVSPRLSLDSFISGGTGSLSQELVMPEEFPDHLEAGTLPGPAIAGLAAGVEWLKNKGVCQVGEHETKLANRFLEWCSRHSRLVRTFGAGQGAQRTGIVSFMLESVPNDLVAGRLDREFNIAVRAGLHCSAYAHETLGTTASGLVRASFGMANTEDEVDYLCACLEKIAMGS